MFARISFINRNICTTSSIKIKIMSEIVRLFNNLMRKRDPGDDQHNNQSNNRSSIPKKHRRHTNLLQLINLPRYSLLPICMEWCSMFDLCLLDSALCNENLRKYFLTEIIGHEITVCRGLECVPTGKSYLLWLQKRNYAVISIQLESYLDRNEMVIDYNLRYWNRLRKLKLRFSTRSTLLVLPQIIMYCSSLTSLTLNNSELIKDATLLSLLPLLPKLRFLDISNTDITCKTLCMLSQSDIACELVLLDVSQCVVMDVGLCAVAQTCTSLESLFLAQGPVITSASIRLLSQHCTRLTELNICARESFGYKNKAMSVDEEVLCAAVENGWPNLTKLNVENAPMLQDTFLQALSTHSKLQWLDISDGTNFTDFGVVKLSAGCSTLSTLIFNRCTAITEHSINSIADHLPLLTTLHADQCCGTYRPEMSLALSNLWTKHPLLTDISITRNENLTSSCLDTLIKSCTQLRRLNISCCYSISPLSVCNLARDSSSSLTWLNLSSISLKQPDFAYICKHTKGLETINFTGCCEGSNAPGDKEGDILMALRDTAGWNTSGTIKTVHCNRPSYFINSNADVIINGMKIVYN